MTNGENKNEPEAATTAKANVYTPLSGPEWQKARETGSDADAIRIHRFKKSPEADGLFRLTHLGMWEPLLRKCVNDCTPAILKGLWHFMGPKHEFLIAVHQAVTLSLYTGLGCSVGAKRNPPTIDDKNVTKMFLCFNDWVRLPHFAMEMTEAFSDYDFRNRFSLFVERCNLIAQDIAQKNLSSFEAAMCRNGNNSALDAFFRRIVEAAFRTGFEAGYERQVYLQNKNEYGADEPSVEVVPSELGLGLIRNGSDGQPDLERLLLPESEWTKYDLYNRAVIFLRKGEQRKCIEYLTRSADAGCAEALQQLGWHYLWGIGACPKDWRKAKDYLSRAVQKRHSLAMLMLGQLHEEDHPGLPKSGKVAVELYRLAAMLSRLGGAYQGLGKIYETGNGVPIDIKQAINFYQLSAAASNAYGVYSLRKLGVDTSDFPEYLHHLG